MEHRMIKDLPVPVVGMGTSGTLELAEDHHAQSNAVVHAALDAGSTFIDTSPMYGRAERLLGQALVRRRSQALVATKVWTEDDDVAEQQIDASLEYFGGHVELFQVHNLVGWRTRLDQLERRRETEQVDLIGATHWKPHAYPELEEVMRTGRIDSIQIPYNPIEREAEERILPLAADLGLGVVVMRPFHNGALVAEALTDAELAPLIEIGIESWPAALLGWVLSDPRISCAIPASSHPSRITANAAAGAGPLLDDALRRHVLDLATRCLVPNGRTPKGRPSLPSTSTSDSGPQPSPTGSTTPVAAPAPAASGPGRPCCGCCATPSTSARSATTR